MEDLKELIEKIINFYITLTKISLIIGLIGILIYMLK